MNEQKRELAAKALGQLLVVENWLERLILLVKEEIAVQEKDLADAKKKDQELYEKENKKSR